MNVSFPTKTYIRCWLISQFGDPVAIPPKHDLAFLLETMLQKKYYSHGRTDGKSFTVTTVLKLSVSKGLRSGSSMSPECVVRVNRLLEYHIKGQMHKIVDRLCDQQSMTREDAFSVYRNMYGITESDWGTDAMRKSYQREEKKLFPQLSYSE